MYTYLFANLFGHQYLEPRDQEKADLFKELGVSISKEKPYDLHTPVVFIPVFTLIEFVAYLGWIKVAETLLNPWGDDDEDFQINYLIDRNFQVDNPIIGYLTLHLLNCFETSQVRSFDLVYGRPRPSWQHF